MTIAEDVVCVHEFAKKGGARYHADMRGKCGRLIVIPMIMALAAMCYGCDAIQVARKSGEARKMVEIALFEGGYGVHWHQAVAKRFNEAHADKGYEVKVWGDPRVEEKVKPRILRGDPPEICLPGSMPTWLLIAAGKMHPFDEALAKPAWGTTASWREMFMPGTLDTYTSGGHVYSIPSAFGVWSCWYDARMFREHGWTPPATWSEFNALCDRIKEAGIAPIAYQGKYPMYAWDTFVALIQRCGGLQAINRINAMETGSLTHPDVVWAARLLQEMALNHFQKGAMAMSHTEGQLQFVNGQAAMIYCGIYLENEMRDSTPPGFEMRCFNVPAVEGGKGNPRMFKGEGAESLFAFADAPNIEEALEFIRYMISPENAPSQGSTIGVISPLRGATPRESVSPALQSVLDITDVAPGMFNVRIQLLFPELVSQTIVPCVAALLQGTMTPEEVCRRLDDGLQMCKAAAEYPLPDCIPYDPVRFGEQP